MIYDSVSTIPITRARHDLPVGASAPRPAWPIVCATALRPDHFRCRVKAAMTTPNLARMQWP